VFGGVARGYWRCWPQVAHRRSTSRFQAQRYSHPVHGVRCVNQSLMKYTIAYDLPPLDLLVTCCLHLTCESELS
jgi:hypothetical protein